MTAPKGESAGRNRDWLLTLLPALPIVLLVLRIWYLGRQDMPTVLLLVQHVNPLGPVSALVMHLMWAVPVTVLAIRALGTLLSVSAPDAGASRLAWAADRIPGWAVALVALLAALLWQLRFLPLLLMTVLAIFGLRVRRQRGDRPPPAGRVTGVVLVVLPAYVVVVALLAMRLGQLWGLALLAVVAGVVLGVTVRHRKRDSALVRATGVSLPAAVAVPTYLILAPAIGDAWTSGEWWTTTLLAAPPALAVLLTGPVPAWAARGVTHWPALAAALLAPFLAGVIFIRMPVLPPVALELAAGTDPPAAATVVRGGAVTSDDTMTVVLTDDGLRFIPNAEIVTKTLCPDPGQVPASVVTVHGWHIEQTALEWLTPAPPDNPLDPRCLGRPRHKVA